MNPNLNPEPENPVPETLPEENGGEPSPLSPKRLVRECYDWVEMFVVTLAVIMIAFAFALRPTYVVGPSMNHTLHEDDALVVSNFNYTPAPGDIVVFQSPDGAIDDAIVKRVIALEGQTVDIDFDTWTVTVDGVPLEEDYVNRIIGAPMRSYDISFPVTVPEGCLFVLGDNRNSSSDSRSSAIGFVDTRFVFGRVLFRILPFDKLGPVN